MNNESLHAVHNLKLQNISEDEIRQRLQTQFTSEEIEKALVQLKDMRADPVTKETTSGPLVSGRKDRRKLSKKAELILLIIVVFFATLALMPSILKQFNKGDTNRIMRDIAKHFNVDRYYVLDSLDECNKRPPTSFGEIAGQVSCRHVTAVAYYPKIELSDYTQPDGLTMAYYLSGSKPTRESISTLGAPQSKVNKNLSDQIGVGKWDVLEIAGISNHHDKKDGYEGARLDGLWSWSGFYGGSSSPDWIKEEYPSIPLKESLDKKILAEKKLAEDAPSTSEALKSGKAPLIVVITDRYCHGLKIPPIEYVCLLPN